MDWRPQAATLVWSFGFRLSGSVAESLDEFRCEPPRMLGSIETNSELTTLAPVMKPTLRTPDEVRPESNAIFNESSTAFR